MTAEDKLANIEAQVTACSEGRTNVMNCPYCSGHTKNGDTFCCLVMATAVYAILLRQAQGELIDHAARIADRIAMN